MNVFLPGGKCGEGEALLAVVDPRSEVDESDEDNDSFECRVLTPCTPA